MKDFKFTEAERGDLEDAMYDLQWKEEIDVVLDRIETIIQSRAEADGSADKDREILHLNDVIKSAQAEIERLKQTAPKLVLPERREIDLDEPIYYQKKAMIWNDCIDELRRLNPHLISE